MNLLTPLRYMVTLHMRKYLVTGGLGFLGAALARALLQSGHSVRILDNGSRGSKERLGPDQSQIEIIQADIRDADAVSQAVRGVDVVCHLAFVNGTQFFYERPAHVLEVGVKGIVNVLDACIQAGVGELILASSSEVYQTPLVVPTDEHVPLSIPDPLNPRYSYAGGKIISELMALNYGREHFDRVVIFRPHNVYGPNMGWEHVIPQFVSRLRKIQANAPDELIQFPIQGSGRETRAFIYIVDFIDGLLRVIQHGEHLNIYNIGTSEELQIREVASRVARCLGAHIHVVPGPVAGGGTHRRCPDISKLKQLGFSSRFSFDAGLQPTVMWYAEHAKPGELVSDIKVPG